MSWTGSKKKLACSTEDLRPLVDLGHDTISVRRQCELLGVNRTSLYYMPKGENEENLQLMRLIDEQYTRTPFFGSRRMAAWLRKRKKLPVNRKRVARLMEVIGLEAALPEAQTEPTRRRSQDLSLFAQRRESGTHQPGLEH